MRSLILPLLLAAAPLAVAAPQTKAAHMASERGGDPELQSLHRQLAAAVLVAELKLTPDQKSALKGVLAETQKVRQTLRKDMKNDKRLAAVRSERKAALRAAIDEVHTKGSLSEETRESMKAARKDAVKDTSDVREKMKELRKDAIGILTPEQIAHMKDLREARVKKFEGKHGVAGKTGKKRLMRLLLSDEFAAELDR